jgi:hypothetical protein
MEQIGAFKADSELQRDTALEDTKLFFKKAQELLGF